MPAVIDRIPANCRSVAASSPTGLRMLVCLTWFSPASVDRRKCLSDCDGKTGADSGALT